MTKKVGRPKKPETLQKENDKLRKELENLKTADREQYEIITEENLSLKKQLEELNSLPSVASLNEKLQKYKEKDDSYQEIVQENFELRKQLGQQSPFHKSRVLPDKAFGVAVRNGKYLLTEMRFDVDTGQASVISSKEFCKNNEHYYAQYEFQKLLSKDDTIIPYKE